MEHRVRFARSITATGDINEAEQSLTHHHVLGGHTAVAAADVHVSWLLRLGEPLEGVRVLGQALLHPRAVVREDVVGGPFRMYHSHGKEEREREREIEPGEFSDYATNISGAGRASATLPHSTVTCIALRESNTSRSQHS